MAILTSTGKNAVLSVVTAPMRPNIGVQRRRPIGFALVWMVLLGGCGDGSTTPATAPAQVRTLAYVRTVCRDVADGFTVEQDLRIQRPGHAPVIVAPTGVLGPIPRPGGCTYAASNHTVGVDLIVVGAFQRLGVSPDGKTVIFEVSGDFSLAPLGVPETAKGIFAVEADGTRLRRLGPPSGEPPFFNAGQASFPTFAISPNGHTIAFTDRGPGITGEDAIQIVTLDIATGRRTQVTRLPPTPTETRSPGFIDNSTLHFRTSANADGLHPDGTVVNVIVNVDGTGLRVPSNPVPLPGAKPVEIFSISGSQVSPALFELPGIPRNGHEEGEPIQDVFLLDGEHVLQLTDFRRNDTYDPVLSGSGDSIAFVGAGDPLGSNPDNNCQIFSIDRLGGHFRQLTSFRSPGAGSGCLINVFPLGCIAHFLGSTQEDGTLVFYSDCDPFGTGVQGGQIFAMDPDGSGLHQLTNTRGFEPAPADGGALLELPGPFAYPGSVR